MIPLDSKDREILEFLHREGGADIQELCDLMGVTRNAIRQRIARMEAIRVIEIDQQSQGRGRPKNVYRVTADGLHALGEDYRELAIVFWEAITGLEDGAVRQSLMAQVRDRLAYRFQQSLTDGTSISQRVDELAEEMKSSGFNVETERSSSLTILRETNCPFPRLADVDETICQLEREVLEKVLGTSVAFRNRCRDGHHCCEFEVQVQDNP